MPKADLRSQQTADLCSWVIWETLARMEKLGTLRVPAMIADGVQQGAASVAASPQVVICLYLGR